MTPHPIEGLDQRTLTCCADCGAFAGGPRRESTRQVHRSGDVVAVQFTGARIPTGPEGEQRLREAIVAALEQLDD